MLNDLVGWFFWHAWYAYDVLYFKMPYLFIDSDFLDIYILCARHLYSHDTLYLTSACHEFLYLKSLMKTLPQNVST